MTLVLDAGAFLAIEREERPIMALLKQELHARRPPRTHGGIVGQVWRGRGGRQARLARFLDAVEVVPLDRELGRRAGALLGATKTADVLDAALALLAQEGDVILTSDPADLSRLVSVTGVDADIVRI